MEQRNNEIAIIGMSCIFPGAPDLTTFWHNIVTGKDAFAELPESRLSRVHYDPNSRDPDRVYCLKGGFIDPYATFNPLAFGITPTIVEDGEPDQFLALKVTRQALLDAGYSDLKRTDVAVVIGKGSYQNSGSYRYNQRVRTGQQFITGMSKINPLLDQQALESMRHLVNEEAGRFRPENTIGLVPSFTAAWIANRMDFHGPAYTIDAACASSLLAVKSACNELRHGTCSMAITGGMHILLDVGFWSVFCHLNVMSHKQEIRPLSRSADGLLIGEGIGILVLKRLQDAIRDEDRVYAVLRGVGVSSDGRETSIMKPLIDGQIRAIESAWNETDLDRQDIGLIEAHSPGTLVGDKAELTTLSQYFGAYNPARGPRAIVGSVKSNIGHTMPAAGAASLIKTVLAIHHGTLPPSLRCEDPHEMMDETRFKVLSKAETWNEPPARRLAGVNAFGFGGTNAHVVVEGFDLKKHDHSSKQPARQRYLPRPSISEVQLFEAKDKQDLLGKLEGKHHGATTGTDLPCRLAIWDPTPDKIAKAIQIVQKGLRWHGRHGIYHAPQGLIGAGGKVAFVFPGVEAKFHPDVQQTARHFSIDWPEFMGTLANSDENGAIAQNEIEKRGAGIIVLSSLLSQVLGRIGIKPDIITGHSIGEWSGMIAAGMFREEEVRELMGIASPKKIEMPDVAFGFVGCAMEMASRAIDGLANISISHDNCPHQTILCGKMKVMQIAFDRLQQKGIICKSLTFQSGFHSPLFAPYLDRFAGHIDAIALGQPTTPVWSAMTLSELPADLGSVRKILKEQLVNPVRFTGLINTLYAGGARVFVQVGSGSLCGFIDDTLHGMDHVALDANAPKYTGLQRLVHVALAMHVEGAKVDLKQLPVLISDVFRMELKLKLGTDLVPFSKPEWGSFAQLNREVILEQAGATGSSHAPHVATSSDGNTDDSLISRLFMSNMEVGIAAQKDVMGAWRSGGNLPRPTKQKLAGTPPREGRWSLPFSSALYPEVLDHAFFKQPEGWPSLADRYPIAPMTMMIQMMIEEAAKLADPTHVAIRVEDVKAGRWMHAEPPSEIFFKGRFDGIDCVEIAIEGHASARVIFAPDYPRAPEIDRSAPSGEKPIEFTVKEMYAKYMFHGPAYHGIIRLDSMGDKSIRGELKVLKAKGNLLDTAGQLFGLWAILNSPVHCMPFPVHLRTIKFFGPEPQVGDELSCVAKNITPGIANDVAGDLDIMHEGRLWCQILHWLDFRVIADDRTDQMLRLPSTELLSYVDDDDLVWVKDRWSEWNQKERMMFRYMGESERSAFFAIDHQLRNEWILKTIIAKDALRHFYFGHGRSSIFPIEILLDMAGGDPPRFATWFDTQLVPHLSIAYADGMAVAMARKDEPVGVAIDNTDPTHRNYIKRELSETDRLIVCNHVSIEIPLDQWAARIHVARTAARKLWRSKGSESADHVNLYDIRGEHILLNDLWIATTQKEGYVIAWTLV